MLQSVHKFYKMLQKLPQTKQEGEIGSPSDHSRGFCYQDMFPRAPKAALPLPGPNHRQELLPHSDHPHPARAWASAPRFGKRNLPRPPPPRKQPGLPRTQDQRFLCSPWLDTLEGPNCRGWRVPSGRAWRRRLFPGVRVSGRIWNARGAGRGKMRGCSPACQPVPSPGKQS